MYRNRARFCFFFFFKVSIFPLGTTKHPAGKLVRKKALAEGTVQRMQFWAELSYSIRALAGGGRKKPGISCQNLHVEWYISTSDTSCFLQLVEDCGTGVVLTQRCHSNSVMVKAFKANEIPVLVGSRSTGTQLTSPLCPAPPPALLWWGQGLGVLSWVNLPAGPPPLLMPG